jgi:hypothetical protein
VRKCRSRAYFELTIIDPPFPRLPFAASCLVAKLRHQASIVDERATDCRESTSRVMVARQARTCTSGPAVPVKNSVPLGHIEFVRGDRKALIAMSSVLISSLAALRGLVRSRAALHLEVTCPL